MVLGCENMGIKLPYYMAYPASVLFDDSKREEWDYEYLKSMYPELAKKILPYVEEECERMDYEESMIYDEYPDKLQLRLMCSRIYRKLLNHKGLVKYLQVDPNLLYI